MTMRQQKYKQNRILGMSGRAAALAAGYSWNYASCRLKKLDKVVDIGIIFEMQGLTDKKLAAHAEEGLEANKTISAIGDANGKSTDFIDVPDWQVRHKYFETILKLRGKLKPESYIDQSQHTHITITDLARKLTEREMNGRTGNNGTPAGESGIVLPRSIGRNALVKADPNNGVGPGQSQDISSVG